MNPDPGISFEDYLDQKPCLEELLEYIDVDNVWIMFGVMLQMDKKDLPKLPSEAAKAQAAIELWLSTPGASRRQLLETLRNGSDKENAIADNYEKKLKEDYETNANCETGAKDKCQLVTGHHEKQSSHIDNQVEKLKISLSLASDHIDELKEKLETLSTAKDQEIENLTAVIKGKEFDIEESNSKNQDLQAVISRNEEELASLQQSLSEKEHDNEILVEGINNTEKELASFKELSENRLQEVEHLKLKLNDTEEELASFRELSENRLKDVTRSVNELSEKLETQQKISRVKGLENEDLRINIKEKDEKIAATEEQLASVRELLEGRKRETEKLELKIQRITDERESLQEKLSLMSQELTEREETIRSTVNENEGIKTKLKSMERQLSDRDRQINELQAPDEKGSATWYSAEVQLVTPTAEQCTEVIAKLSDKHQNIYLRNSSSDIAQVLIPPLLEKNHIISLYVSSTPLTQDFLLAFSHQMSGNNTLQSLSLGNDSINDEGVITLMQSLKHNKKLLYLSLEFNCGITSACVPSLANFICANCTLSVLYLSRTNIDANGVCILVESLKANMTLNKLVMDSKHKAVCSSDEFLVKSRRLEFSYKYADT